MSLSVPVKIKKLNKKAQIPFHGSAAAAGYDVFACIDEPLWLAPHQTVKIPTGIAVSIPQGYWMGVYARSGLAAKEGLRPANCTGVIDADYRGQVIVALHNDSSESRFIQPGEKIAQLIVSPFMLWDINEVNELDETKRGIGSFGSTGK